MHLPRGWCFGAWSIDREPLPLNKEGIPHSHHNSKTASIARNSLERRMPSFLLFPAIEFFGAAYGVRSAVVVKRIVPDVEL